MNKIVIFTALLGLAAAAPGYYFDHEDSHDVHYQSISSPSKTTITKTSQEVNHGGHHVVHVPVHHEPLHVISHEPVHVLHHEPVVVKHEPVHALVHTPVHVLEHKHIEPAKSSQYFKLENTVYKTPKVVAPVTKVISTVPVVHTPVVHASVYHAPIVTRTGDSAISHHSSYTHETEHEIQHLPLYSLHH